MNSRQKGARGERQVRDLFRDVGLTARRGQQFSGGPDSPDVIVPELEKEWHVESKWVQGICSAKMRSAIEQSQRDASGKAFTVFHKENDCQWLVTLDARDFVRLLASTVEHIIEEQPV